MINPRVLPSDIMAVEGVEDTDTLDLSAKPGVENNRARSLGGRSLDLDIAEVDDATVDAAEVGQADQKLAMGDGNDGIKLKVTGQKDKKQSRKRRDVVHEPATEEEKEQITSEEEQQFPDVQSRQFGPQGFRP